MAITRLVFENAMSIAAVMEAEKRILAAPQIELQTEHVIHGGMYARTIRLQPEQVISGAHFLVPTILIVSGNCLAFTGERWIELAGFQVIAASTGRKQIFVARQDTAITMIFRTDAKTVEEAEAEFTDEHERLMSRRSTNDIVTITEE